ncbi:hypothetical protein K438DRAFT_1772393 [Mycena galopus ATCC 62051]|nr:hypothetical protein K438DRAFT_1772393 [Mycena galopus ATCC 62051]
MFKAGPFAVWTVDHQQKQNWSTVLAGVTTGKKTCHQTIARLFLFPCFARMSDPTLCRARDADGKQCICMRADAFFDEETKRTLCRSCSHIASAHPEPKPGAGALIRGYRDAAKLGMSSSSSGSAAVKASLEEAETETSAGLRPKKRKSDTDTEPASKKIKGKGKKKSKIEGEKVKYGKLVLLTCGISLDGTLNDPRVPSPEKMDKMRNAGLVVLATPSKPLIMNTGWDNNHVNIEVKKSLREPITYLETHPYPGASRDSAENQNQYWLGVIKQGKNLALATDSLPSGVELAHHCKVVGRPASDRVLFLASKARIPEKHWKWGKLDSKMEELGSDIDTVPSEDIIMTPRKPAPKKTVKVKAEPDDTDMKKAAKMRTRLSTRSITHKPLFIPGSSDGEAEPSSSAEPDIVDISDDELPPDANLRSMTWDPSPPVTSNSPIPFGSPNGDPPTFWDDFAYHSPPPDTVAAALPGPSTTSYTSSATFTASFASPTPASTLLPPPAWPANVPSTSSIQLPHKKSTSDAAPRFKKMGKGRADRDPRAKPAAN